MFPVYWSCAISSNAWIGTETTLGVPQAVEIRIRRDGHCQTLGEYVADDRRNAAVAINYRCSRGAVIDDKAVVAFNISSSAVPPSLSPAPN